jgi:hypothetical protein
MPRVVVAALAYQRYSQFAALTRAVIPDHAPLIGVFDTLLVAA